MNSHQALLAIWKKLSICISITTPKPDCCGRKFSGASSWDAGACNPKVHSCSLNSVKGAFPHRCSNYINRYHMQAVCLRSTINLRITLSGHQESRNSAKNCDLNLFFFGHLPGTRLFSTSPNHATEWQTAACAVSRGGLPCVLQGSQIVDCLYCFLVFIFSYTKWLRST